MNTTQWLEENQPEMEDAVYRLMKLIKEDAPRPELLDLVDYLSEFWDDSDPRSMGWVGSDGLP